MAPQGKAKSNGIPPRAPETRSKKPELADKLQKIDQDAESGKLSSAKVESAQAQINHSGATNGEQTVDPHSKPPFDSQEDQRVPSQPIENDTVEPNDTPMAEATDEFGSEPSANSAGPRAVDETAREDDGMLVSFRKMSLGNSLYGGVPEAWCSSGFSRKAIVRHGPLKAAKYMLQSAKGYNLKKLREVSDRNSRITQIWDRDENGKRHRRYTVENIEGIVGVVVQEGRDSDRVYKTAPRTYLKVKFIDIAKDDEKNYLSDGCAWVPKSDLDGLFEAEMILDAISEAWDKQEERYHSYENGAGRGSPDRLPSVCPLNVFVREKRSRTRSTTPKSSIEAVHPQSKLKKSPGASTIIDFSEPAAQAHPPYDGAAEVKEEDDDYPSLSVVPEQRPKVLSNPPAEKPVSAETPQVGSDPITFSKTEFFSRKAEEENWDNLSRDQLAVQKTIADALWLVHRKVMLANNAVEVGNSHGIPVF